MNETMALTGPEYGPEAGGEARQLVILLHGVGADGQDLIGLAPELGGILPHAAFVAPNAPYPCDMAPHGYQWFSILFEDPEIRLAEIRRTALTLNAFIDEQLARHNLADHRMALVGFSQGTMMALFVAPRRARPCAGIMGFSGRLEAPQLLTDELRCRMPVTLVHGERDELLPASLMDQAAKTLGDNGFEVETHLRPGLGHGIDEGGVMIGMRFLAQVLGA